MMRTISVCALMLVAGVNLTAADKVEKGFKSLWNGKDFTDWKKAAENEDTFTIKDGAIVAKGPRAHLYYVGKVGKHDFKDFELKVDCMTLPVSNGGIYFHTAYQEKSWPDKGFEVQVNNSHGDWRRTGGLYAVADQKEKLAEDGKWFTEHIIVKGNTVKIYVDGKLSSEWTQPEGWVHPQFKDRKLSSGTFALQGHDPKSTVMYKNIRVKILK
ncbi:MAG: DUF1080 domain-containing protein [Acidobacteriota bacterium]|nr:DUF1080 domain-containing protein [Bryobacteraceae bacterium CoA2 C42]MCA2966756.1 DUF1080 domain-containing protein [Acidobacteriaceae bacterium]